MPFDPTQPFEFVSDSEAGAGEFDPSKPFEILPPTRGGALRNEVSAARSAGENLSGDVSALRWILGDPLLTAVQGIIAVPEAVVGLSDIPTFGYTGRALEKAGVRFKDWRSELETLKTPEQQEANAEVRKAWDASSGVAESAANTFSAVVENPSVIPHAIIESIPGMVTGGLAGRALAPAITRVAARFGFPAAVATVSKAATPGAAKLVPTAAAETIGAGVGEGLVGAGSAAEQFRQGNDDGLMTGKQVAAAIGTGLTTSIIGAGGNRLADALKLESLPTVMVRGGLSHPKATLVPRLASVLGGAVSEGVLQEMPQSALEQMWSNWATGKPLYENVGAAAAFGGITGAAMGGGVNLMLGPHAPVAPAVPPALNAALAAAQARKQAILSPAVSAPTPVVTAPTPVVTASTPVVTASTPAVTAPTPTVTASTPASRRFPSPPAAPMLPPAPSPGPAPVAPAPAGVSVSVPTSTPPVLSRAERIAAKVYAAAGFSAEESEGMARRYSAEATQPFGTTEELRERLLKAASADGIISPQSVRRHQENAVVHLGVANGDSKLAEAYARGAVKENDRLEALQKQKNLSVLATPRPISPTASAPTPAASAPVAGAPAVSADAPIAGESPVPSKATVARKKRDAKAAAPPAPLTPLGLLDRLSKLVMGAKRRVVDLSQTTPDYKGLRARGGITLSVDTPTGVLQIDAQTVKDVSRAVEAGQFAVASDLLDQMEAGARHEEIHRWLFSDGKYAPAFEALAQSVLAGKAPGDLMRFLTLGLKHLLDPKGGNPYRGQFETFGAKLGGTREEEIRSILQTPGAVTLALNELLAGHGNTKGAWSAAEAVEMETLRRKFLSQLAVPENLIGAPLALLNPSHVRWLETASAPVFPKAPENPRGFKTGDKVAFAASGGPVRGVVVDQFGKGPMVRVVFNNGDERFFPVHAGWQPDAEVLEPAAKTMSSVMSRAEFDKLIEKPSSVPITLRDRVYDLLVRLADRLKAQNLEMGSTSATHRPETRTTASLTGSLTRVARKMFALEKGYKRASEESLADAQAQLNESMQEAETLLASPLPSAETASPKVETPKVETPKVETPESIAEAVLAKQKGNLFNASNQLSSEIDAAESSDEKALLEKARDILDGLAPKEAPPKPDSKAKAKVSRAKKAVAPAVEEPSKAASEGKLDEIKARRAELFKQLRQSLKKGPTTMSMLGTGGFDPESLKLAGQIAATYAEEGVVKFADFAARVKEDAGDIWDLVKGYLHAAWQGAGAADPRLEDVTRSEAAAAISAVSVSKAIPSAVKAAESGEIGYHFGDGGVAVDTLYRRMGGRGSGHFGTGTYFFGSKEIGSKQRPGRPLVEIPLGGLRLARPGNSAAELHSALSLFNRAVERGEPLDFSEPRHAGSKILFELSLALSGHSPDQLIAALSKVYGVFQTKINDGLRTPSTYLMQELGYDGVDVRGTPLDNADYGSVVFVKPSPEYEAAFQALQKARSAVSKAQDDFFQQKISEAEFERLRLEFLRAEDALSRAEASLSGIPGEAPASKPSKKRPAAKAKIAAPSPPLSPAEAAFHYAGEADEPSVQVGDSVSYFVDPTAGPGSPRGYGIVTKVTPGTAIEVMVSNDPKFSLGQTRTFPTGVELDLESRPESPKAPKPRKPTPPAPPAAAAPEPEAPRVDPAAASPAALLVKAIGEAGGDLTKAREILAADPTQPNLPEALRLLKIRSDVLVKPASEPSLEEQRARVKKAFLEGGDKASADIFHEVWNTLSKLEDQQALLNQAAAVASGEITAQLAKAAHMFGLPFPGVVSLATNQSPWGGAARTGGLVEENGQIKVDLYGAHLYFSSPEVRLRLMVHELWHPLIRPALAAVAARSKTTLDALYQSLYQRIPNQLRQEMAAQTTWRGRNDQETMRIRVEEFLRMLLEKHGQAALNPEYSALAKFADASESVLNSDQAIGRAVTAALVEMEPTFRPQSLSTITDKVKSVFRGLLQSLESFLTSRPMARPVRDSLAAVFDAAIKEAKAGTAAKTTPKATVPKKSRAAAVAKKPSTRGRLPDTGLAGEKLAANAAINHEIFYDRIQQFFNNAPLKLQDVFRVALRELLETEEVRQLDGPALDNWYKDLALQLVPSETFDPRKSETLPEGFMGAAIVNAGKEFATQLERLEGASVVSSGDLAERSGAPEPTGRIAPKEVREAAPPIHVLNALLATEAVRALTERDPNSPESLSRAEAATTVLRGLQLMWDHSIPEHALISDKYKELRDAVEKLGVDLSWAKGDAPHIPSAGAAANLEMLYSPADDSLLAHAVANLDRQTPFPRGVTKLLKRHVAPSDFTLWTNLVDEALHGISSESARASLPPSRKVPPLVYGYWVTPDGEMLPTDNHISLAWQILERKVQLGELKPEHLEQAKDNIYDFMAQLGYLRMAKFDRGLYSVEGMDGQPINREQRAALERFGIEHDQEVIGFLGKRSVNVYTPPDARSSLPPSAKFQKVDAHAKELLGAISDGLAPVLSQESQEDEHQYLRSQFEDAKRQLDPLVKLVQQELLNRGAAEAVALGSDEFEAALNDPRIVALAQAKGLNVDRLRDLRTAVLEETHALNGAGQLAKIQEMEELLSFWQEVKGRDPERKDTKDIVANLEADLKTVRQSFGGLSDGAKARAYDLFARRIGRLDSLAARRAARGPLVQWLQELGSVEDVSQQITGYFDTAGLANAMAAQQGSSWASGASALPVPGPLWTPGGFMQMLQRHIFNQRNASEEVLLNGYRKLLSAFDRRRRQANLALESDEADALNAEIGRLSSELAIQRGAKAQKNLDFRTALRTLKGQTGLSSSLHLSAQEQLDLESHTAAIERFAIALAKGLSDEKQLTSAREIFDFLLNPQADTQRIVRLGSLGPEFGLSVEATRLLLRSVAKSPQARDAVLAVAQHSSDPGFVSTLNELQRNAARFQATLKAIQGDPKNKDAQKAFREAQRDRDKALTRVVDRLRLEALSLGAEQRGLENKLNSAMVRLKTLEKTAEVFEQIAASPQFNAARTALETADQTRSLRRLVDFDDKGNFVFRPFGRVDPKTGRRDPTMSHEGLIWTPAMKPSQEAAFGTKVASYYKAMHEFVESYKTALIGYDAGILKESPAQQGYDYPEVNAAYQALLHDEPLVNGRLFRNPDLEPGVVGLAEDNAVTRFFYHLWQKKGSFVGGKNKMQLEALAKKLPGQSGKLFLDALQRFVRRTSDLKGALAFATDPAKAPENGLPSLRLEALRSHGFTDYQTYREQVLNRLMMLGRLSTKVGYPLKVGQFVPGTSHKVTAADLKYVAAEAKWNRGNHALMQAQGRPDDAIIEGDFSRFALADWVYPTSRFMGEAARLFVDEVAAALPEGKNNSLAAGDASAEAFWNSQLHHVIQHVLDYQGDPAELVVQGVHPVLHAAGKELALKSADGSVSFETVANLNELANLLASTKAAADANVDAAALKKQLGAELDKVAVNARDLSKVEDDRLMGKHPDSFLKLSAVTTDGQFTSPFGARLLPSSLYEYGALTDADHARIVNSASQRLLISLFSSMQFANREISNLITAAETTAAGKKELASRFEDIEEAELLQFQLTHAEGLLARYVKADERMGAKMFLFDAFVASLLASPTVAIGNVGLAPIQTTRTLQRINVGQFEGLASPAALGARGLASAVGFMGRGLVTGAARMAHLDKAAAAVGSAFNPLAKALGVTGDLGVMAKNMFLFMDREQATRDALRGIGGTERLSWGGQFRALLEWLNVNDEADAKSLPEKYRSWDSWMKHKGLDPAVAGIGTLMRKLDTSVGDQRTNAALMGLMDLFENAHQTMADFYVQRMIKEGKIDPADLENSINRLKFEVPESEWALKTSDATGVNPIIDRSAKLQELRNFFRLANVPNLERLMLDWKLRQLKDPNASLFTEPVARTVLQAFLSDVNTPNVGNRPFEWQVSREVGSWFRLWGFGVRELTSIASYPIRVRRTAEQGVKRSMLLSGQSMLFLGSSAAAMLLYGSLTGAWREWINRYGRNQGESRDTVLDKSSWESWGRLSRVLKRDMVGAISIPWVPDILSVFVEVDPFGKSLDPSDRTPLLSFIRLLVGEAVTFGTTWAGPQSVSDKAYLTGRQAREFAIRQIPLGKEFAGMAARTGLALEGRQAAVQASSASRRGLSQVPDQQRSGGASASARLALNPSPYREPVRIMMEAQAERDDEKYQRGFRMFVAAHNQANVEAAARGIAPTELEDRLRTATESLIPFRAGAKSRLTEPEVVGAIRALSPEGQQTIADQVARVSAIRGGAPVELASTRGSSGGGGNAAPSPASLGGGSGGSAYSAAMPPMAAAFSGGGGGGGGGGSRGGGGGQLSRRASGGQVPRVRRSRLRVRRLRPLRNRLRRRLRQA